MWDRVAACESGGNWSINTGNGFSGGLQFTGSTWRAYGGSGSAHNASKAEQIRVAKRVLAGQGPGAWPVCSKKAGLGRSNGGASSADTVTSSRSSSRTSKVTTQRSSSSTKSSSTKAYRTTPKSSMGSVKHVQRASSLAFPGASTFSLGHSSAMTTLLGQRLVAKGFGDSYRVGPGPVFTAADKAAVASFQRAQGWTGADADGIPGPATWSRLMAR
ncbi:transglycosylase family protein [Arsenicicoccus piscis]|uniref:Resuscitation-promoting factor core lysozyme-like domain-containing protein n=1 Tax=Arsenicicoccus piscis TaxID=673954 RepID=A0ABQ6HRW4_9MICO|nr:hypothetical protein GCM10025862_23310 [Arsenicicoccus piscis]